MAKILVLVVVMVTAASVADMKQVEATSEVKIQLGDGLHFEDDGGILYENSVPLIYELRWEDLKFPDQFPPDIKWAHCYNNSTCMLAKILSDYQRGVSSQLDNMEPQLSTLKAKQRRFSVMGWILKQCCGVATQDDFETLYKSEDRLETHIQDMKSTVHEDHRALTELATNSETLTKEFNGILDQAKHRVTEMMIAEINLEKREETLVRHMLTIYKSLHRLIQKVRKNAAANACQSKRIPPNIVQPKIFQADLSNLTSALQLKEWELAVPIIDIGKYYGLSIASCALTTERIVVRVKIPIRRANQGWRSFYVQPIPVGDANSTCIPILPSKKVIISEKLGKLAWIVDDRHCQPEINKMCFVPRGIKTTPLNLIPNILEQKCVQDKSTIVTFLEKDKVAISNPPTTFQVHCGQNKDVDFIKLPVVIHGYLEVSIPCDCVAIIAEDLVIEALYPCGNDWAENFTTVHIIPNSWTSIPKVDVLEVIKNESLSHQEKLNSLLTTGWEVRSKTVKVQPDQNLEEPSTYLRVKQKAEQFHMEWTTVITLLIFVIIFREPLNVLLVRIVSPSPPPQREGFQRPA